MKHSETFDRFVVDATVTKWCNGESESVDVGGSIAAVSHGAAETAVKHMYEPLNHDVEIHSVTRINR